MTEETEIVRLKRMREELLALRYGGESEIQTRNLDASEKVAFKSDKELAAALADLDLRIEKLTGRPIRTVLVGVTKGFR